MKAQKGITLIALVITIIVMLILVGVTITMTVQGGLFERAGEATSRTNAAKESEKEFGSGFVNIENGPGNEHINNIVEYYKNDN